MPNALENYPYVYDGAKQTAVSEFADEQLEQAQNTLVRCLREIKVDYHVLTQVDSQALSNRCYRLQQTMYNRN